MKSLKVLALALLLSGCSSKFYPAVYAPNPYFNLPPTPQIVKVYQEIVASSPVAIPTVQVRTDRADERNAFIYRIGNSEGPIMMVVRKGFLQGETDSVMANLVGHELGHAIHGHLDVGNGPGLGTPKWKQREADDTGMYLAYHAGYNPCDMAKVFPLEPKRQQYVLKKCNNIDTYYRNKYK